MHKFKTFLKRVLPIHVQKFLKIIYLPYVNYRNNKTLHFQVHLTYHCNLGCKGCSHFSSISKDKYLDVETFESDFKQLQSLTKNKIRQIDLLGGETLLHPQINIFLSIARKYFKRSKIILFTNGILLKNMPNEFWDICAINNIVISISNYPIKLDINNIMEKSKRHNVDIYTSKKRTFGYFKMDIKGLQNAEANIEKCFESKNCHCLDHGKMYLCYIPACINIFNDFFNKNIPVIEEDYIDIYKVKHIKDIIQHMRKPMIFCKLYKHSNSLTVTSE